jgi:hypothetical protein
MGQTDMQKIEPFTPREMLEEASRAIGKVVRDDVRAITLLSVDEIAAMTGTLIAFGLIATAPGQKPPQNLVCDLKILGTSKAGA